MTKQKPIRKRLSCTTSKQVNEAVTVLLWSGLYGTTRSAVVERLLSQAIEQKIREGTLITRVDIDESHGQTQ